MMLLAIPNIISHIHKSQTITQLTHFTKIMQIQYRIYKYTPAPYTTGGNTLIESEEIHTCKHKLMKIINGCTTTDFTIRPWTYQISDVAPACYQIFWGFNRKTRTTYRIISTRAELP